MIIKANNEVETDREDKKKKMLPLKDIDYVLCWVSRWGRDIYGNESIEYTCQVGWFGRSEGEHILYEMQFLK